MELINWAPGLRVGAGYDIVRGEEKQEAVVGTIERPINAAGQQGEMSFVLATNSDEVDKALDINASINVGVGPFSGSAKMKFHESCKVSNQATFCVISVNATNAFEQLVSPKLTPEALVLLAAGKKDRFRERFGDSFVSGQFSGIEFHGVVRIEASQVERQKQIAGEIQASYGFMASGKASVDFKEKMSSSSHRIEIMVYQSGGEVSICTSVEEMMAAARKALEDGRNGKAYPFQVTLDPFSELELPNDSASLIDTEMASKAVKAAMAYIADLRSLLNDIDYVRRNREWYKKEQFNMNALNDQAALVTSEINRLWQAADMCSKHFDRCEMAVPKYPDFVEPERIEGVPAPSTLPSHRPGRLVTGLLKPSDRRLVLSPAAVANLKFAQTVKLVTLKTR